MTVESPRTDRALGVRPTALRAAAPALLGYLAVRALGVLTLVVAGADRVGPGPGVHGTGGLHRLATLWDAYWYQQIALHGYAGTSPVAGPHGLYEPYAFFPAYPLLIRLVPLPVQWSALAVAWAAALAAAWGVYAVAARLYGQRAGVIAAALWGVLPYAVVENAAYSEPLFTALAAWSVHAAVRGRWIRAGLLCLLAGLSRPTGIALAAAVGAAALWELLHGRGGRRAVAGALLAPLGFVGFVAWVGVRKERWDGYFRVQDAWQSRFDYGRATFRAFRLLLPRMLTAPELVPLADVVVAGVLVAGVVLFLLSVRQRQPPVLLLYSAALLVLALGDAAYFNSRARFLLPAFGLLLPIAAPLARTRHRTAVTVLLAAAAVLSAAYGFYAAFVYPDAP
ncbi:hypothetical protein [Kitasatospora camelliae]|uniref:Dolichyl-phosphate-mannose-protein mannosyltransferase n=1 Tax=Kitasatospora camelliae TaxID=3156397 RepID=A0AAU8JYA9_9ACTN